MKRWKPWFSITAGAGVSFLLWEIWYSKVAFRQAWLDALYIKQAKLEAQKEAGLGGTVAATFITYWVLSLGVHYWLEKSGSKTMGQALASALALWVLILTPIVFLDYLWEFRRFDLLCLDGAHLLTVVLAVAAVSKIIGGKDGV